MTRRKKPKDPDLNFLVLRLGGLLVLILVRLLSPGDGDPSARGRHVVERQGAVSAVLLLLIDELDAARLHADVRHQRIAVLRRGRRRLALLHALLLVADEHLGIEHRVHLVAAQLRLLAALEAVQGVGVVRRDGGAADRPATNGRFV